jgi:uncharacterized sulfatase
MLRGVARGLVEFVDLYPMIAELCRLSPPRGLAGRSLRPLLADPSRSGKDAAVTIVTRGSNRRGDSIRTDRWRFTQWSDGTRELYDHLHDPEETKNVVGNYPDIAQGFIQTTAAAMSEPSIQDPGAKRRNPN